MDFSQLLSREIAQKKAAAAKAKAKPITKRQLEEDAHSAPGEKRQKPVLDENQEEPKESDDDKITDKRTLDIKEREEERSSARADEAELKKPVDSSDAQIQTRLTELNEPAVLDGETVEQRAKRLRKIEKKRAKYQKRQKDLEDEHGAGVDIVEEDIEDDPRKVEIQIRAYIKQLVGEWAEEISQAKYNEKSLNVLRETQVALKGLFRQLRTQTVHFQLYPRLARLLIALKQGDYHKANDVYIDMSIGNAPWPVGVRDMALHERSNLSHIGGDNDEKDVTIAHIMTNEETRQWLHAVKRLITFCENRR